MFKNNFVRPWICARCVARQTQAQKRLRSTSAASQTYESYQIPVQNDAAGASYDDKILRKIFDSGNFWKDFSHGSKTNATGRNVGLFGNRYLTSPKGFELFANTNLRKAKRIVDKVLGAASVEEYKTIAKDLDRLSDMLCRVIDLSDFVRSTHPDVRIQAAASQAHATMFEYMNILNTTTGLNEQLVVAMANPDIWNSWSEEEKVVAQSLKKDFAKSAIALPKAVRDRFVSLSQEIAEVGHVFVDEMAPAREEITIPANKLRGMDPTLARRFTRWGQATLPTVGDMAAAALRSVHDEETRRDLFIASKTASPQQIQLLEELLSKRAELARLTGYNNYAELALGDKMAKSPDSVNQFLQALSKGNRPRAQQEMAELLNVKMRDPNAFTPLLQPWDRDFYVSQIRSSMRSTSRNTDFLSSYFSLGTVMQGLSRLFTRLYGIRLIPRETMPGETWNEDVRRLDVMSETDGHVAVLYCDLFSRAGKSPNPAHFTLRCSREIANEELEEARSSPNRIFASPQEDVNDGMATSSASGALKQLPTIALICDFRTSERPSLLSFGEVQTLFHEMGHAIHSILGRTSLQEVSGTRCPTDFAELPSVLMEHFASDPAVLSLFARHYETDQPLPYEMVAEKLALDKRFAGSDTEHQIILAMLDQAYHSFLPLSASFSSTQVFHEIQKTHGILPPDPPGTCWQGLFGHLAGYGSTYYSYLFDQVLAERIWKVVFKSGKDGASIDRVNGENMKEKVLRWGGGRSPWRCVADVLDDGRVEHGDEKAMAVVGSWWGANEKRL
jgi:mitochondrial intermediate peptidase